MSALSLQISYQSIESSDPAVNVPGPRRTVSKLRNETYHVFSNLHPGTTYLFSVRARTGKGFGQTALTEITTNISGGFPGLHPGAGAFLPPRDVTAALVSPACSAGFWWLGAAMEGGSWWWQLCCDPRADPKPSAGLPGGLWSGSLDSPAHRCCLSYHHTSEGLIWLH